MEKKYELTEKKEFYNDRVLYEIKALKDFNYNDYTKEYEVKKGDLGGWVESEENLSHEGDCWVFENGMVCDNALLCGNAQIHYNVKVLNNANVSDDVQLFNTVRVCDNAMVCGNTEAYNFVKISGNAKVYDSILNENVKISGNANVSDSQLSGNVKICDYTRVYDIIADGNIYIGDNALVCGGAGIYGNTFINGDSIVQGGVTLINACISNPNHVVSMSSCLSFDNISFYKTNQNKIGVSIKKDSYDNSIDDIDNYATIEKFESDMIKFFNDDRDSNDCNRCRYKKNWKYEKSFLNQLEKMVTYVKEVLVL